MAGFNLPTVGANADTKALANAFMMLVKELKFLLQNLDSNNVTHLDANKTVFENLEVGTAIVELLLADTIASNTSITQVLYAEEGRIARLTVDHLLTGDFLSGDEKIYFIDARDQYIRFIEATRRDDLPQVQYTDIDGGLLYWDSADHLYITPNETDYPVMVYVYDLMTKMQIDFEYDSSSNAMVPKLILGAGVGNPDHPNWGRGNIYKDATGLMLKYLKSNGELLYIKLGEDGIEIEPPLLIFPDVYNDSQVVASGETALPGLGVTFKKNTKVAFDVQMDITASEAMTLTVQARVDGVEHRHTVKHFSGAYKDGLCFNGILDPVGPGEHTVDIAITPSAGTATIDAAEYRMMLTIRDGTAKEAEPWPEAKVLQPYYGININSIQTVSLSELTETLDMSIDDDCNAILSELYTGISIDIVSGISLLSLTEDVVLTLE